jgi:N-acetylneuraminic acid mutarotase
MASFPGVARKNGIGFSIGEYGFVGLGNSGSSNLSDFYKWNQSTNKWSSIANYPGVGSFSGLAFSCEGMGYVGMGLGNSIANDLWQYDTTSNKWTQMSSLPGSYFSGLCL